MKKNIFKRMVAKCVRKKVERCKECGSNEGIGIDVEFLEDCYILHCSCIECGAHYIDRNQCCIKTTLKKISKTWRKQCLKFWNTKNKLPRVIRKTGKYPWGSEEFKKEREKEKKEELK